MASRKTTVGAKLHASLRHPPGDLAKHHEQAPPVLTELG
jgi:hypothetical protein